MDNTLATRIAAPTKILFLIWAVLAVLILYFGDIFRTGLFAATYVGIHAAPVLTLLYIAWMLTRKDKLTGKYIIRNFDNKDEYFKMRAKLIIIPFVVFTISLYHFQFFG